MAAPVKPAPPASTKTSLVTLIAPSARHSRHRLLVRATYQCVHVHRVTRGRSEALARNAQKTRTKTWCGSLHAAHLPVPMKHRYMRRKLSKWLSGSHMAVGQCELQLLSRRLFLAQCLLPAHQLLVRSGVYLPALSTQQPLFVMLVLEDNMKSALCSADEIPSTTQILWPCWRALQCVSGQYV